MKLDELERLDRERTQGTWLSYSDEGPIHYPATEGQGWMHSICLGDERKGDVEHVCIGTVLAKDEPQARADSDVIAAAVNSLGPLLKVMRAAEQWAKMYDDCDLSERRWPREIAALATALKEAKAVLEP